MLINMQKLDDSSIAVSAPRYAHALIPSAFASEGEALSWLKRHNALRMVRLKFPVDQISGTYFVSVQIDTSTQEKKDENGV